MELNVLDAIERYFDAFCVGFYSKDPTTEVDATIDIRDEDNITEDEAIRAIDEIMNHESVKGIYIADIQRDLPSLTSLFERIADKYNIDISISYRGGERIIYAKIFQKTLDIDRR